jgi:hypothetical protein
LKPQPKSRGRPKPRKAFESAPAIDPIKPKPPKAEPKPWLSGRAGLANHYLHKPGKPRYDTPKAYRPIALLNTLCKVLTAIVANVMTFYTEKHELLPATHFGGRPGRTTTDARE